MTEVARARDPAAARAASEETGVSVKVGSENSTTARENEANLEGQPRRCEFHLFGVRLVDLLRRVEETRGECLTAYGSSETYTKDGKIGQGTYGTVFGGTCKTDEEKKVVIKQFKNSHLDAMQEVAAYVSIGRHPNIAELLDVGVMNQLPCLVLLRYQADLGGFARKRPIPGEEVRHIMLCLCKGIHHIHARGLVHSDIKPPNVFVSGASLRDCDESKDSPKYARRILELPAQLLVVIGDVGSARCGDPSQRCLDDEHDIPDRGILEGTLWYRAFELLAGKRKWSYPVDCWAVGCIGAELALGHALFKGQNAYDMLISQLRLLGTPPTGSLRGSEYPCFPEKCPDFCASWPPPGLSETAVCEIVAPFLVLDPSERLTMSRAVEHPYFSGQRFNVSAALKPAGRGLGTILTGQLEEKLIGYLQSDPWWCKVYARMAGHTNGRKQCLGDDEVTKRNASAERESGT